MTLGRYIVFWVFAWVTALCPILYGQSAHLTLPTEETPGSRTRPPVRFPHGRHIDSGIACTDCHHDYQDGQNAVDESDLTPDRAEQIRCAYCHNETKGSKTSHRDAFHLQCIGCHARLIRGGVVRPSGPRLCGLCHARHGRGAEEKK
ncbi:MAG: cytochrome c3 family protein [Myxococcota bacterium]|nr:cytochrome c3 family protein [Myxococcota bacterium]